MTDFLTLDDMPLRGKKVLLRADLNVPMQDGQVGDTTRLKRLVPTLNELREKGAKIIILSHCGRPKGKPNLQFSLRGAAAALAEIWGRGIAFAEDCIGPQAEKAVAALTPGEALVLENTRFHAGEEANDPAFTKQLAALGEVFVNDAFSVSHRANASVAGLPQILPALAGRLMQEELDALHKALEKPARPLAALIGGSKISTKLDLLQNLVNKVDVLILGGGMANTFLAARGIATGKSICESDMIETARSIMKVAATRNCHILLPKDAVVAAELKSGAANQTVSVHAIPGGAMILDLGPASIAEIKESLAKCKTVVWNGPLGAFETKPFDHATNEIARYVAGLTKKRKILSVAGGGDTVAALNSAGVMSELSYVSTAGGAFLEWLEGKELPGVATLKQAVDNKDSQASR